LRILISSCSVIVLLTIAWPVKAEDPPWVVTVTVEKTVQGKDVDWWSRHAVQARKDANKRAATIVRLKRIWEPTVDYAYRLAARVSGVPEWQLRRVGHCESTDNPRAANGRQLGLFQLGWSPFGFSPFDPIASALSAAFTVRHDGSWRQWTCKP
jgi:hypothetical protein